MSSRVPNPAALQEAVLDSLSAADAERGARFATSARLSAPLSIALERIQSRRRLLLAWHLFWGPRRFEELRTLTVGVPKRRLREELQALEADGLVERRPPPDEEAEAEYGLTALGEALKPALASLYLWGLHVQDSSPRARSPKAWA